MRQIMWGRGAPSKPSPLLYSFPYLQHLEHSPAPPREKSDALNCFWESDWSMWLLQRGLRESTQVLLLDLLPWAMWPWICPFLSLGFGFPFVQRRAGLSILQGPFQLWCFWVLCLTKVRQACGTDNPVSQYIHFWHLFVDAGITRGRWSSRLHTLQVWG